MPNAHHFCQPMIFTDTARRDEMPITLIMPMTSIEAHMTVIDCVQGRFRFLPPEIGLAKMIPSVTSAYRSMPCRHQSNHALQHHHQIQLIRIRTAHNLLTSSLTTIHNNVPRTFLLSRKVVATPYRIETAVYVHEKWRPCVAYEYVVGQVRKTAGFRSGRGTIHCTKPSYDHTPIVSLTQQRVHRRIAPGRYDIRGFS